MATISPVFKFSPSALPVIMTYKIVTKKFLKTKKSDQNFSKFSSAKNSEGRKEKQAYHYERQCENILKKLISNQDLPQIFVKKKTSHPTTPFALKFAKRRKNMR